MTVVLKLSGDSLLRCRFAVSPLHETTDALRALTHPGREVYHLSWQRQARPRLPTLQLDPLLALLAPSRYQPDFITPPPAGPFTEMAGELDAVAATPVDRVVDEMDRWRRESPRAARLASQQPILTGEPVVLRDLLVEQLERAWSHLVRPWWPQLREVLASDITARARQLADAGTAAVLDDLHPKLSRRPSSTPPAASTGCGIPAPHARRARTPHRDEPGAILVALDEPTSTTGLAARCHLPLSTVSEHLAVLRANGLVATVRTGRYLAHQQTPLGTALTGRD